MLRDFGIVGLKGSAMWPFAEAVIAHGMAEGGAGWRMDQCFQTFQLCPDSIGCYTFDESRIVPPTESLQLAAASLHL